MSQITLHLKFPLLSMIEEQSLGKYPTRLKRNNFIQGRPRRLYVVPYRETFTKEISAGQSLDIALHLLKLKTKIFFAFWSRPKTKNRIFSS